MALLASTRIVYQPTGWEPVESVTESISGTSSGVSEDSAAVSVLASIEGTSAGTSLDGGDVDTSTSGAVEPFFADSFETGDRSHSANGFAWGGTSSRVTVSSERARTGAYSLKFDYSMGSPEQRFSMGQYAEIWFEWYVWLPADYEHPNANPGNNKFFMLWGHSYENNLAPKVGAEYWPASGGPNSYLRPMYDRDGDASTRTVPEGTINPWIGGAGVMIPGQWNRIRIHAAIGTSGNLDGVYQFWTNDDLTYSSSTLDIYPDGTSWPYFDAGYFLGSAGGNPGAAWFIDDVKFYDQDPGW